MRRLFYVAFGATVGVIVVRRLSDVAARWTTPEGLTAQANGAGDRIAAWWSQVQAAAAEREGELREGLGLGAADTDTDETGTGGAGQDTAA
jgi:hypothetical protein